MTNSLRHSTTGWFALAAVALLSLASVSVVGEAEQAVVLRLGEPDRVINRFKPEAVQPRSGAGVAFHVPLLESVTKLPRGLLTLTNEGQAIRTTDMQGLVIDTAVTVRVIDPVRLVGKLGGADRIAAEIDAWLPAGRSRPCAPRWIRSCARRACR
jgi:modulator of FtsH protease HflC